MSQLSFFIPIDLKQNSLSGLAEGYFAYGQSRATLQPGSRAVDLRHCPQPLWKTALKVISLATLILPSAFLMVKVWHRWTHTYTYTPSNQTLAKGIGAIEDRDRVLLTFGSEGSTYRLPHHEDLIFFVKQPLWADVVALEDKRREHGFNKLLPPTCGLHSADTVVYKEPLISVLQEQEAIFERACEEDYTDALTELFHYIVKCNVGFVDRRAPIYAHQGKIQLGLTKLSEDVQGTLIDMIWTVNEQQAEHLLTLAQNHF
ncbi:MAG: hypothetical protein KDK65_06840, partial [Chlamydiia bacterium]|nr:hypothetical protein [Chlamydiia bacterium]